MPPNEQTSQQPKDPSRRRSLKYIGVGAAVVAAAALGVGGYTFLNPKPPGKQVGDTIKVGFTISQTGFQAPGAVSQMRSYELWRDQVNAAGGLNLSQLGKKVPITFDFVDDGSDPGTTLKQYDRLITQDNVELLLAPYGTPTHFALGPALSNYKIPVVGNTSIPFEEQIGNIRYLYFTAQTTKGHIKPAVDFLKANSNSVKKVAIAYVQSEFPLRAANYIEEELGKAGMQIVMKSAYPIDVKDLTGLLSEVKSNSPDAYFGLCYPADAFLMTGQTISLKLNTKFYYELIGPSIAAWRDAFGQAVNGITSMTLWVPKLKFPGSTEFFNAYQQKFNAPPDYLDSALAYASCQILQQAVEKVGAIDYEAINRVLQSEKFSTILGPVSFQNQMNAGTPGLLAQWQQSGFEAIYPADLATSPALFPKPDFP